MKFLSAMTIDINDFPYYRDSVLVKRFESFLSANPEGQDAWVDITAPINWSPNANIQWTGSVWRVTSAGSYPNYAQLILQGEQLRNFFPYGYRFTFTPSTTAITVRLFTNTPGESSYNISIDSGYEYCIFPNSSTVFKTNYGYGQRISFTNLIEISKIEYRRIPFIQDFDWSQIWHVDITNLVDYNFTGFSIIDESLFMFGFKDSDIVLNSFSNGIWSSEIIKESPGVGGVITPFIYNNRKAYFNYGAVKVAFGYQDELLDWQYEEIPYTINPSPAINTNGTGFAFAPGNIYSAISNNNDVDSPYVNILKRTGDSFATLSDPADLPTGVSYDVCWSRTDATYLVVAHAVSPRITIYKRASDTFTKLSNPGILPTGDAQCCAFSYDDVYLAVGHKTTPFLTIYKRSLDTFTKLSNPGVLPGFTVSDVEWSHDGTYLVCTVLYDDENTYPFLIIYKRSGDTFTKLDDQVIMPTYLCRGAAFSHDDSYLLVLHAYSGILYTRSGDTFTVSNALGVLPANLYSAKWSSDSTYLFMTGGIYKQVAGVFTSLANNIDNTAILYDYGKLDISDDDLYFGIGNFFISKRTGDLFNQISQGSSIENNTIASIAPFIDSDNNLLCLVDVQFTVKLYKRTPVGTWTRVWFRGCKARTSSFWVNRNFGAIDSNDTIHHAYYQYTGTVVSLWYLTYTSLGVLTTTTIDTLTYYTIDPSLILQDNGYPIILYTTPTTKLAIFNGATWDLINLPIRILTYNHMVYESGRLYIYIDNTKFIVYDIATDTILKSDFVYPEQISPFSVLAPQTQNLEKTDFYIPINYSGYKSIIYKRGTGSV